MTRHFQAPLPSPSAEEEKRERRLSSRASRLETSGVRVCAAAGQRRHRRGEAGAGAERGYHQGRAEWPPPGKDAVPARPRARPLAPPGPRAGTHAEGTGRAAGERRLRDQGRHGRRRAWPCNLLLLLLPHFRFLAGARLAARSRSDPAPRAAPIDCVTAPPAPPPPGSSLAPGSCPGRTALRTRGACAEGLPPRMGAMKRGIH